MNFSKEQLQLAEQLACENWEKENPDVGFQYQDIWIANPFVDSSGRFDFKDITEMYQYYGQENVDLFINQILDTYDSSKENHLDYL